MLLDHNEWMKYWENVACKYKPIAHDSDQKVAYARVIDSSRSPFQPYYYTEEFTTSLRNGMNYPCLIVESTRENYRHNQQMHGYSTCGIVVLMEAEKADYDSENLAVDQCKKHVAQLVAKLQSEIKAAVGKPAEAHFEKDSLVIHNIGPMGSKNLFGARAEFVLRRGAEDTLCVNDDLWAVE